MGPEHREVIEMTPDFEQFKKALRRDKPDRIPIFETLVGLEIQSQFLGRNVIESDLSSQVEFWQRAGYDHMPLPVGMMNPGEITKESRIYNVVQQVLTKGKADVVIPWNIEENGIITTEKDFDEFPWDDASKLDFTKIDQAGSMISEGMKIVAVSGKIFTLTWMLMGFQNFAMSLTLQQELTEKVFQRVGEIQLEAVKRLVDFESVGALLVADDLCYGSGPLINPKLVRRYVFPWYEAMAAFCREHDLLYIFHSDGNIWSFMNDLIALGFDAVNPIDPTCMDIKEVKEKAGRDIGLIGNVSTDLLATGSEEEVRELTKWLIKEIGPGGGYALGSGNSVTNWSKFENYQAMRNTALSLGTYPLSL
jgi:uroporphyrinogen decarboxylase